MNATYLFRHVFISLLVAGEQLVSDHVLLSQHLILLLHLQVRLEGLVEDVSLELVSALAVIVALSFHLFELAQQIALLELHLKRLVAPAGSKGKSEVLPGAHLTVVKQLDAVGLQGSL